MTPSPKPKMGVPQLWHYERTNEQWIVYPDGYCETWSQEWYQSSFSDKTQKRVVERLRYSDGFIFSAEFICNIE